MNSMSGGAPYVGASAGLADGGMNSDPMRVSATDVLAESTKANPDNILLSMNEEHINKLECYLTARLSQGVSMRNRRIRRFARTDKAVSTWQRLNAADTKRLTREERTGKAEAIPFNMPIMSTHLSDMTAFFSEILAPVANPFFTKSGDDMPTELTDKLNRDAAKRSYYSELSMTLRSLLKYNIGGMHVDWDSDGGENTTKATASPGNCWKALNLYNTFWDPSIRDLNKVHCSGEWAATVELTNRFTLLKNSLDGTWSRLEDLLSKNYESDTRMKYYKEPSIEVGINVDGEDGKTGSGAKEVDWDSYGMGLQTALGPDVDGFEKVVIYCWLIPAQFGLLTDGERKELESQERNPEIFLELWKFEMIGDRVVAARPQIKREDYIEHEPVTIPIFISYLTQDQVNEAQRSIMELMQGFQRFSNNMYNIYVAGMRKQVWGVKGVDPTMFDTSALESGDTVGILKSKKPGADVRMGFMDMTASAGVDQAMQAVGQTMELKDRMFPTQALPNNVAGIDRAVKSQVAHVMQGSTRPMKAMLRILDACLMLNTRIEAFRNLKRYDDEGLESVTEEDFAKLVGSGIESLEAERIAESLWQLLYAIIQNQEAMQVFNIPAIFAYIGRISNLSTDLSQFVRPPPQEAAPPQGEGGAPVEGQPQA